MTWEEFRSGPGFSDLSPTDQTAVRAHWLDTYVIPDMKKDGFAEGDIQAARQKALSSYDNGQGYITSFASSVGRGVAGAGTGIIGGLGAITGNEELRQTANEMDASIAESLPVNPSLKYTNLAGNAIGQAGTMLATGGVAGFAGKALGGIRAGTMAASAGVLTQGGISEARGAADEADQYGITGDARALKIASGILTGVGTEFIPFGLGAELRGVNTLLGAGERVVGKRAGHIIILASEPVEEVIGQIGNNAATAALAPAGTETPGLMTGTGDAAFGGLAGGATFAGFNAAAGANRPAPGAPPVASPSTDGLPPPAGFTQDPTAPVAPGIPGRASVVNPATPTERPGITDAELAAMEAAPPAAVPAAEQSPAVPAPVPVPQDRINITAAAIATSPTPEVEAAVIETAKIAADLNAQKTTTPPVEVPAIPAPAPPAGIPMAESQPPAPEIAPAAEQAPPAILNPAPGPAHAVTDPRKAASFGKLTGKEIRVGDKIVNTGTTDPRKGLKAVVTSALDSRDNITIQYENGETGSFYPGLAAFEWQDYKGPVKTKLNRVIDYVQKIASGSGITEKEFFALLDYRRRVNNGEKQSTNDDLQFSGFGGLTSKISEEIRKRLPGLEGEKLLNEWQKEYTSLKGPTIEEALNNSTSPIPTPPAAVPAAGIPVAESQPPAPEIAPAAEISPPPVVQKPKPKSRRFEADPGTYPLVTAIVEAGISPRNPAAELARARANRRENLTPKQQTLLQRNGGYNDVPTVKEFAGRPRAQDAIRKMLRNGSQNTPDVAVQQAAEFAGRDPQEFYGNTAWQEIREELMKLDDDVAAASKEDERMNAMEKQAVEFYAAIGEGKYQVDVTTMEPGDTLIIEGENVTVKKVNRDKNGDIQSVELQDGTKFGRQEIDATTALFVEEFQEDPTDQTPDVQIDQATLPPEPGRGPDVPESRNMPMVQAEPGAQGEEAGTAAPAPTATAPIPARPVDVEYQKILNLKGVIPLGYGAFQVPEKLWTPARRAKISVPREQGSNRYRVSTKGEMSGVFYAADSRDTIIYDESVRGSRAPRAATAPSATESTPTPAPEVTADGQRDMLAGRADEPFNLTAESPAERKAREAKELAAANKARQQKEEAARKALEAATPELPMAETAEAPQSFPDELRASGRNPDKIPAPALSAMEAARRGDAAAFSKLTPVQKSSVTDVIIRAKDGAAADALGINRREFEQTPVNRAEKWADKTIAANKGQLLSGVPDPTLMAAYVIKGSILLARGIRNFAKWSKAMLDEFGEAIRPHLQQIFADSHANDGQPITDIPAEPAAAEKPRSIFEKFFGHDKQVTAAAKEFEARNAGRAALSTLLFDGIAPDHQPGTAFEDTIATLTPEQRNALHDRVLDNLFRMTGDGADADAYARELKAHLESVPELAGQRNISMAALQYTNLVTAAGILSGVYGQTSAFSTIIQTDNDQLKFGLDTTSVLRSDLGRLLGSQSGIGGRIAEFASIIAKTNKDGLKRIGLTDSQIDALSKAVANKTLTANEIEEIFAASTTSPKNASLMDTALARLQRLVDAAAAQVKPGDPKTNTSSKDQTLDEYAENLADSLLAAAKEKVPPNERQKLRKAVLDWIRGNQPEAALADILGTFGISGEPANSLAAAAVEKRAMLEAEREARKSRKPESLAKSILSDKVGPLVAKLPVNQIVRAMMAAPAHHRNSAAWRELQINRWLAEQGIDSALASRLARSMDEMVAAVMANVIYQEQERYITGKKGVGEQAISNPEFAAKYQANPDAVREAIRKGLLDDGAPWQAWFSSVTGIQPLSQQVIADIARLESVLSGDKYLPSEKGIAAAKLRDLMDAHFGKDASGWEILASGYDQSSLTGGTVMGVQVSAPLGRLIGNVGIDLILSLNSSQKITDVMESLMASINVYAAELPLAWKYDTAGHTIGNEQHELAKVAVLRRDLEKYLAILKNDNASMAARAAAIPRVLYAAQDFFRQAMNAADAASMAGFQRYYETREIRSAMRRNGVTKEFIRQKMNMDGFYRDKVELQADALGYDGPLKRRFIQDALWAREKDLSRAATDTPEEHAAHLRKLAIDSASEAQNQIFIGENRDAPSIKDPVMWALGNIQQLGQAAFRKARERTESDPLAGSIERVVYRSIFGFVGIPLNAAMATLWYSPLAIVSWVNYYNNKSWYPKGNPYARSLNSEMAVRQRIKETIVGNTLILLGIALAQGLGGDDEDKWQVNGYGPDPKKYPEEAKAWRRRHTSFAMERIGKDGKTETIPFKKGPLEYLTAPLMLLAGSNDARLNSKLAKEPVPETRDLVIGAIRQLGISSLTTGMQNVAGFRETLQNMGQNNDWSGKQLESSLGFMASPIVPYSGALRWISTWDHPELLERGFKNNLPLAVYWNEDARPALNSFGQNLRPAPEITESISRQTAALLPGYARTLTPDDNRLYAWMERTGKQPTTYARSTLETRLQQPVTDAQWWEYTKASGQVRYQQTLAAIDGTLPIERTIPLRGKDIKRPGPMKKGLADIDTSDKAAMKQAGEILQDIGKAAHMAGLKAIGMEEPAKEKPAKKKTPAIY